MELLHIGRSLIIPEVSVVAIGLLWTSLIAAVLALRSREMLGAAFLVGGVMLTVLALLWTMDAVLPLRVVSVESQLTRLEQCAVQRHSSAYCPHRTTWRAPLFGAILRPANYWNVPGEIAFPAYTSLPGLIASGVPIEATDGFFYEPEPSLAMAGPTCVRHLYGPWYEYGFFAGDCPWGFSMLSDNASRSRTAVGGQRLG
jgi:hypothetical protein